MARPSSGGLPGRFWVALATAAVVGPALARALRLRTGAGLSAGTQSAALAMGCVWLGYYAHAGCVLRCSAAPRRW
jgi:hypothetical protein